MLRYHNKSHNDTAPLDTTTVTEDKVRRRSDRNVRNYNKLVVADEEPLQRYETAYRGKVQNKYVEVEMYPMYAITYYEQQRDISTSNSYSKPIEDINS